MINYAKICAGFREMHVRRSISISLSPELQAVAEGLLASERYGNISDMMRIALRLLEERELEFQAHRAGRFNRSGSPSERAGIRVKYDVQ